MKIAILGLGKIGGGVYELAKAREDIRVKRVLDVRAWAEDMTTDIREIVNDPEIEAVVEAMGGVHPAREYALKALESGKHFISANKHMLSECALELMQAAAKTGASVRFGAACGGGIPYLKILADARLADTIISVGGILNGTTNFILDLMQTGGLSYAEALMRAQALGYAEKDPASDVDGLDVQRKLSLAALVAFGRSPRPEMISTRGIRGISGPDIAYFSKRGLAVRLIARARLENGEVDACVQPELFFKGAPESAIRKNVNYAWYEGEKSGFFAFSGQGAGRYPTACNLISDVLRAKDGSMLPDGAQWTRNCAGSARAYYARIPESALEGVKTIFTTRETRGEWVFGETMPVEAGAMRAMLAGADGAFYAAMNEGEGV